MSFVNFFRGKSGSRVEKRNDVQSPLIAGVARTDNSTGSSLRPHKESLYLSQEESPPKNSISRSATTSKSRKLSVVDLLEQAEQQSETFSKLFPLIDTERYNTKSESSDSDGDMTPLDDCQGKDSKERKNNKCQKSDRQLSNLVSGDVMSIDDGAAYSSLQKEEVFTGYESSLVITSTLQPPESLDKISNRRASSMFIGVHIEYLILDNKLKVSVHRVEDEPFTEKERKKRIAKLYLMPGNVQCQKVNIIPGTGTPHARQCAYFSGIEGNKLVKMELGVGIYLKQGILKKDKLIMEWSIPLSDINFMEPQTAWKVW